MAERVGTQIAELPINVREIAFAGAEICLRDAGYELGVAGQQPSRSAGVVLGVILPQSATRTRQVTTRHLSRPSGVDVVVDRPPLQLRDRQHLNHPPTVTATQQIRLLRLWHMLRHNHSRTPVQMCRAENGVRLVLRRWRNRKGEMRFGETVWG